MNPFLWYSILVTLQFYHLRKGEYIENKVLFFVGGYSGHGGSLLQREDFYAT